MSWSNELYATYENNFGTNIESEMPLAPISHMISRAQIEITLDETGGFVSAKVVSKQEENTLIPVTEASAGRGSGIAPHSLCDSLSYLAGDFSEYCASE